MKNSNLRRYWFASKSSLGIGVTAYDLPDAISLIRKSSTLLALIPDLDDYVEDVDIQELDQNHVIPNMGLVIDRGVWYPIS